VKVTRLSATPQHAAALEQLAAAQLACNAKMIGSQVAARSDLDSEAYNGLVRPGDTMQMTALYAVR
jgi:hypothetical protein